MLAFSEEVIPVSQRQNQVMVLSNNYNLLVERTFQGRMDRSFKPILHAKFNSGVMEGIEVSLTLDLNGRSVLSHVESAKIYRVSDSSWASTLIGNILFSETSPGVHTAALSQSFFALNELSGAETYLIETSCRRLRDVYNTKIYFNHLGCFDSINRLRQSYEMLSLTKADL